MLEHTRTIAVALIGIVALVAAACAPSPESDATPEWFAGGTFPIEVSIPSRTTSASFELMWGLGTCTTTVTTPSVEIPDASLTLAPVQIDPEAATVVIPEAVLDLPRARISAGSVALTCNGTSIGSIGLSIAFDGAVSVQAAVLDPASGTVTLAETSVSITNASVGFNGGTPVPLEPFTSSVPSLSLPFGSVV